MFLLVALIVSVGLVVCAAVEGYVYGRCHTVTARLLHMQHSEYAGVDDTRRADPLVQAALHSIAYVGELIRRRGVVEQRVAAIVAPFDAKIAAREAMRLPDNMKLGEAALRRIQDAVDNLQGVQKSFDVRLELALLECEPPQGWFRWLLQPRVPRVTARQPVLRCR